MDKKSKITVIFFVAVFGLAMVVAFLPQNSTATPSTFASQVSISTVIPLPTQVGATTSSIQSNVKVAPATSTPIPNVPIEEVGSQAIIPHAISDNLATPKGKANFNAADVKAYITENINTNNSKFDPTDFISVDKVDCMTMGQFHQWQKATYGSYTDRGEPTDLEVCVAFTSGNFNASSTPPDSSSASAKGSRIFHHGYMIFVAATGNYISHGEYK
jgi:hypothetical protein